MKKLKNNFGKLIIINLLLLIACAGNDDTEQSPFDNVIRTSTILNGIEISTWMYQIQWLDDNEAIDELEDPDEG